MIIADKIPTITDSNLIIADKIPTITDSNLITADKIPTIADSNLITADKIPTIAPSAQLEWMFCFTLFSKNLAISSMRIARLGMLY
ncbi:hypothetical protein [Lysinibacillus xylanilyticus]|uniref:hypothetical protein n=1 Tax=Lysinibacillus xylanilyticus TaxID=582475 RepID=UPI002B24E444|nr:hypothetical protein [Lysinibacillus xylanilyticus]